MNKIFVEVYLPAAQVKYDVKIPRDSRIGEITELLENCFSELAGGYFVSTHTSILCERTTGMMLDVNATPSEMGIVNGTKLMLI